MKVYGTHFEVQTPSGKETVVGITESVTTAGKEVPLLGVFDAKQLREIFWQTSEWNLTHLPSGYLLKSFEKQAKAIAVMYKLAEFVEKEFPEFITARDTSVFNEREETKKKFFQILNA